MRRRRYITKRQASRAGPGSVTMCPIISGGGGGGASSGLSSVVTLSPAEAKTLTTTGKRLVAAVTGSLIVPLSVTLELLFATTPYAAAPASDLEIVTGADPLGAAPGWFAMSSASVTGLVTSASSAVSTYPIQPASTSGSPALSYSPTVDTFGQPLWLINFGVDLANGDSPIKVTTVYDVVAP